jgi:hypothetical protein
MLTYFIFVFKVFQCMRRRCVVRRRSADSFLPDEIGVVHVCECQCSSEWPPSWSVIVVVGRFLYQLWSRQCAAAWLRRSVRSSSKFPLNRNKICCS